MLAEATVAALAAGVVGVGLAALEVKALLIMAPSNLPGLERVTLNRCVLLFTVAVSLLSGVASALGPAVKFSSANPQTQLREKAESIRDSHYLHELLVFLECALTMVLLTATGLLLRNAIRLQHQSLGFRTDHLVSVSLFLHGRKYDNDAQIRAFVDEAIRRVDGVAGVHSASIGAVFLGRLPNSRLEVEGRGGANLSLTTCRQRGPTSARISLRQWVFPFCAEEAFGNDGFLTSWCTPDVTRDRASCRR